MTRFQINIKATNLELDDELKDFINEKVSSIEKFLGLKGDEESLVEVEVSKDYGEHHKKGKIYRAEINLTCMGKVCRVNKQEYDIKSAVEESVKEAKREVRKNREKKTDLIRRGAKDIKKFLKFGKK